MSQTFATMPPLEKPAAGHESPEVDLPRTSLAAGGIAAMIVLSAIVSHFIFFGCLQPLGERSATPLNGDGLVLPPSPRLEGIEMMSVPQPDIAQTVAAHQLHTYGWADRDKRLIRVPIERAMELATEINWLPTSKSPQNSVSPTAPRLSTPESKQSTP